MRALPLAGVRVIELCWVWSGPMLGQLLADLGAEVIKVEWYKRFDMYRTRGVERLAGKFPEHIRREMSHSFHGLNRNKIGVTLDLKLAPHRDALLDLARQSDLVIENFTAGTLERLEVGFDALSAANPAIVLLSLSGFGATSRLGAMRAYGLVLSAMSGLESAVVDPRNGEFLGSPTFVSSDPNAASFGLMAGIAAILEARRTGRGSHVEASQLESAAFVAQDDDAQLDDLARRIGLPQEALPDDCVVAPVAGGEHVCVEFPSQMGATERERLLADAARLTAQEAVAAFVAAGARAVRVVEQAAEFGAGAADNDTLIQAVHPITGPENIVAAPWWIDGARSPLRKTAPTLGEGNVYVLSKLLGWLPDALQSSSEPTKESAHAND